MNHESRHGNNKYIHVMDDYMKSIFYILKVIPNNSHSNIVFIPHPVRPSVSLSQTNNNNYQYTMHLYYNNHL